MSDLIKFVLGIWILLLFMFLLTQYVSASTSYGPAWTETCAEGLCSMVINGKPVNMLNENQEYAPFSDVVSFVWGEGMFNLSWFEGYALIEPFVVYKGNDYNITQIRNAYPNVNMQQYVNKYPAQYKYSLNFTNIPPNLLQDLDYIGLRLRGAKGITWGDVKLDKKGKKIILKDKIELSYQDLTDAGFKLSLPNKTTVLISNFSNKSFIWLDPVIQLWDADVDIMEDTWAYEGDTTTNNESAAIYTGGYHSGVMRNASILVKFNISSVPPSVNISTSYTYLCLRHFADSFGMEDANGNENFTVYSLNNSDKTGTEWNEDACYNVSSNACPSTIALINSTPHPANISTPAFICFSVGTWVGTRYNAGADNVSFLINRTYNETGRSDMCAFYSKEAVSATFYPYLNVTYVDNKPPIIVKAANITPYPAYMNDTLYCNFTFTDNLNATFLANISWRVNGTRLYNSGLVSITNNTEYENAGFSGNFSRGDNVSCNVTVYDSTNNTNWTQNVITISNLAPWVENVSISPSPANSSIDLTCVYNYTDLDGDAETDYWVNWIINGVVNPSHNETLGAGNTSAGDVINCSVMVYDGTNNASDWEFSPTINISDTIAPTMNDYNISSLTGYTDTTFYIYVNCTDAVTGGSGLALNFPKVSYDDPTGTTQGPFTMTNYAGDRYRYGTTFGVVGVYENFTFNCSDAQSNMNYNGTTWINFTSSTRPGDSGGGRRR